MIGAGHFAAYAVNADRSRLDLQFTVNLHQSDELTRIATMQHIAALFPGLWWTQGAYNDTPAAPFDFLQSAVE